MPNLRANGIDIEYETFGRDSDDPLLLIMGLGSQMILWPEELCEKLAAAGHYVIRYDNRDVGLSTKLDAAGAPDIMQMIMDAMMGKELTAPYTLDDMADDAVGLLQGLAIEAAHIVGASMGGMIAQTVAYRHPAAVKTLVSIMSTTGDRSVPPAKPEALAILTEPMPLDRQAVIERALRVWKVIGSPAYPFDEQMVREKAELAFERGVCREGQMRQLAAILAHGSRREKLRSVSVPTLVIHGADDPLVPVEGGHDTAAHIPGAELLIIPGMGHDLPRQLWDQIAAAICALTAKARRVEAAAESSAA
ncbi:MAG TPA: alpha/beta fold hydrolase [Terriglobales bacterium]|nr:alpha/beta fold hydrolase [Terriglobales bacterium]